jgi:hypothetical protein
MGYLTVFTETGFPHAGCFLEYVSGHNYWLGFFPRSGTYDIGIVGTDDRENKIDTYIRFPINEALLSYSQFSVVSKYENKYYIPFECDCINFARDMAEACRLQTGWEPMWLPIKLRNTLQLLNPLSYTQVDTRPFPWRMAELLGKWQMKIFNTTWTWIYEFFDDKSVTWTNPVDGTSGNGTWELPARGNLNISWAPDSNTQEKWTYPFDPDSTFVSCHMDSGTYAGLATKF